MHHDHPVVQVKNRHVKSILLPLISMLGVIKVDSGEGKTKISKNTFGRIAKLAVGTREESKSETRMKTRHCFGIVLVVEGCDWPEREREKWKLCDQSLFSSIHRQRRSLDYPISAN